MQMHTRGAFCGTHGFDILPSRLDFQLILNSVPLGFKFQIPQSLVSPTRFSTLKFPNESASDQGKLRIYRNRKEVNKKYCKLFRAYVFVIHSSWGVEQGQPTSLTICR